MEEAQAIDLIRKKGYKITPQRQEIIKAFVCGGSHTLSAEEVHSLVMRVYPGIGIDTVYRNLNILVSLKIINRLNFNEGRSRYELNSGKHHHHLVCMKCGCKESIDFCPLRLPDQEKIEQENKFKIKMHSFEIFGYCQRCR